MTTKWSILAIAGLLAAQKQSDRVVIGAELNAAMAETPEEEFTKTGTAETVQQDDTTLEGNAE